MPEIVLLLNYYCAFVNIKCTHLIAKHLSLGQSYHTKGAHNICDDGDGRRWTREKGVIKCELFRQTLFIASTRPLHASTRNNNNHHQHTTSTTTTDCVVVLDWLRQLVLCRLGRPSKGDLSVGRGGRSICWKSAQWFGGCGWNITTMTQLKLLLIFLLRSRVRHISRTGN